MTEEHLPPKSAGNAEPITIYNEVNGALKVLRSYEHGHTIPSLCRACNGGASERGLPQAYATWRKDTFGLLGQAAAAMHAASGWDHNDLWRLAKSETEAFWLPVEHGRGIAPGGGFSLHPGRIVRQVIGMILAVQGTRHLRDEHPELIAAYQSKEPASLTGHSVHVALAATGTLAYFTDAVMSVTVDSLDQGSPKVTPFWAIVFQPFVIMLCEGASAPIEAARIDKWLTYPDNAIYTKADRKTSYPIALRGDLLVEFLHLGADQVRLEEGPSTDVV
ncbi:hypothetical protein AB0I90_26845 [Micromonospora wenchangensis]|uniref:hypothetical protein n=1 Tax=Micromonospora wenchangensis TaxID=1185415 RepID=UPI0033EBE803